MHWCCLLWVVLWSAGGVMGAVSEDVVLVVECRWGSVVVDVVIVVVV